MINTDDDVVTAPTWPDLRLRGTGGMSLDFSVSSHGWPAADEECDLFVYAHAPTFAAMYDWRPVTGRDLTHLGEWLNWVVAAEAPEMSVPALSLPRPGIIMDVVGSDATDVTVAFTSVAYPDDPDGFRFDTTLLALRHAAVQIAGEDESFPVGERLFADPNGPTHQSLIWRSIELPDGCQLNAVTVTDDESLDPPGVMAMLRGYAFDPNCDAQLELDRLRVEIPGAVASLLGTMPSGDRFGVLVLQSDEEMDDEFTTEWSSDHPLGVGGAPEPNPSQWWSDAIDDELADLEDFYNLEFNEAAGWPEQDAPFAVSVGSCWLPYLAIAGHLHSEYGDRSLLAALRAGTAPPLRTVLRRLLGEAVGVPLDRMLATDSCVLPGWEHSCRYDAVDDALTAWMDRIVAPERLHDFLITDTTTSRVDGPLDEPAWRRATRRAVEASTADASMAGECTFAQRFAAILGPRHSAPVPVRGLHGFADDADHALSDDGEFDALNRAWKAAEQLLVDGVPDGYERRVRDLAQQIGTIFERSEETRPAQPPGEGRCSWTTRVAEESPSCSSYPESWRGVEPSSTVCENFGWTVADRGHVQVTPAWSCPSDRLSGLW